jgi:hypothetical protein
VVAKLAGIGLSAVLMVGVLAMPTQARDDDTTFVSPLIGSNPNMTIGGVTSGGAAWKVRKGQATLEDNGRLEVEVLGLLLVATNTTGPVVDVAASLVCGGSGGSVAATSTAAGLSAAGNAEIRDDLTLPATCPAPVVLIRIFNPTTLQPGAFIALSGISG